MKISMKILKLILWHLDENTLSVDAVRPENFNNVKLQG